MWPLVFTMNWLRDLIRLTAFPCRGVLLGLVPLLFGSVPAPNSRAIRFGITLVLRLWKNCRH